MDCSTFESSEAALEGMNEDKFDLAIVDIMLPGMDGEEFISIAAQKDSSLKYLIHTGITNYILPDDIKQFGINSSDVFVKPLNDMRLLIHKITELNSTLGEFDGY